MQYQSTAEIIKTGFSSFQLRMKATFAHTETKNEVCQSKTEKKKSKCEYLDFTIIVKNIQVQNYNWKKISLNSKTLCKKKIKKELFNSLSSPKHFFWNKFYFTDALTITKINCQAEDHVFQQLTAIKTNALQFTILVR